MYPFFKFIADLYSKHYVREPRILEILKRVEYQCFLFSHSLSSNGTYFMFHTKNETFAFMFEHFSSSKDFFCLLPLFRFTVSCLPVYYLQKRHLLEQIAHYSQSWRHLQCLGFSRFINEDLIQSFMYF